MEVAENPLVKIKSHKVGKISKISTYSITYEQIEPQNKSQTPILTIKSIANMTQKAHKVSHQCHEIIPSSFKQTKKQMISLKVLPKALTDTDKY